MRRRRRSTAPLVGWLVLAALAVVPPAIGAARPGLTPEKLAERKTAQLIEPLGLSEGQAAQVVAVLRGDFERKIEIFGFFKGRIDQETVGRLREELQASQQQTRSDLDTILSAEQLARFEEMQQQQRAEAAGELIVHRMQDRLALTPEQREQMIPIFSESVAEQQDLTREARRGAGGLRAMRSVRSEMQTLQRELEKRLKPILSEEQMKAYREYREETQDEVRRRMRSKGFGRRP